MLHFIRSKFLPPESPQELFLRTIYHRLQAMPFFVRRQIRQARASYQPWLTSRSLEPLPAGFEAQPAVTFLVAVKPGDEANLARTLDSLIALSLPRWEAVPVREGQGWLNIHPDFTSDTRIRAVMTAAEVRNAWYPVARGGFLVFCAAGDEFIDATLDHFYQALHTNPDADIYYSDCEYQPVESSEYRPFFKPTAVSPELMYSINYLSRAFLRVSTLNKQISAVDYSGGLLAGEYQLLLQLLASKTPACHIARVLLRQTGLSKTNLDAMSDRIRAHYDDQGYKNATVTGSGETRRLNWDFGEPSVSLIILNRDHGAWLKSLLTSIFTLTDYSNFTVIIVDNDSTEPEVRGIYDRLASNPRVSVVPYEKTFNYSEAINIGVSHSEADVVVLMNNDMRVTQPGWLGELVQWALHPEIGVVGAKLLHRNRSIQHAGIILGMNGFIGHLYLNAPEHYHGLAGSADWYRNFYAITGACQAMRRDLFNQVGGYDERFRLAFGDIDFCLRVAGAGYRNLYNPHSQLTHFEGGSRGYETPVKDILLGYEELRPWLEVDDPYFSPNLTYTPIPRANDNPNAINERLLRIENRKRSLVSGPANKSSKNT